MKYFKTDALRSILDINVTYI